MLPFLLVNLLGLALGAGAWWLARRGRRWALVAAGVALAGLVFKSWLSHKPAWEADLFPWAWYIYLQGYWIFALGLAFFGLAIPQLPLPRNRRAIAVLALFVAAWGVQNTLWMAYQPVLGEERHADALHHCRQSTGYTCAPAACVCALSHVGVEATEREMAALCLTRAGGGTTRFNTYRGLLLKLAGTRWRPHMVELPAEALCLPGTVAVIDFPEQIHAISVHGEREGVTLHDPLSSKPSHMSLAELNRCYGGLAIVLEPIPP